jgi:predicted ArsR family transcriptional regulator
MVTSHFIAARVSSETKTRLKSLAEQRQLSESALLKHLLELTLDGAAEPKLGNPGGARRVARAARLYLRLRPDDHLLLAERAAARGMAAATYVSVLVRAHLRHLTPLPKDELVAFRRSIAELGAIGRNLNQIAHTVQRGGSASGPRREDVVAMLRVCTGLRDHFKATLLTNLRSWQAGHDSPDP